MDTLQGKWNQLAHECGPKSGAFLQSWGWGAFQEMIGRKVYRYILKNNVWMPIINTLNHEFDGVLLVIKIPLPAGRNYLYVPRGPVVISDFRFKISDFLTSVKRLAQKENSIFVKLDLPIEEQDFNNVNLQSAICNLQSKSIQPRDTLIVNLEKTEEELRLAMHEKTRYNIRLAERKGVAVRFATQATIKQDIEQFWHLAKKTAVRDNFNYHSKEYYEKMLGITSGEARLLPRAQHEAELQISLLMAEKDGKALAANIVTFFGNTVTYLHGASDHAHREFMAPYLLQWRTIQEARRLEFKYYDFWGIMPMNQESRIKNYTPKKNSNAHPWTGITRFKLGFGGEEIHYAPTVDLPISKLWYKFYQLAKRFRN